MNQQLVLITDMRCPVLIQAQTVSEGIGGALGPAPHPFTIFSWGRIKGSI